MATQGYTDLDDFMPEIWQYVNGAPAIMLRSHIIRATIDFCGRTLVLKANPAAFMFEEDVALYTLKFSNDRYRAVAIDDIRKDGDDTGLARTSESKLDSELSNWRSESAKDPSAYFLTEKVNEICVYPKPSQDGTDDIIVKARVVPKRDQTEVDELLYEKWSEVIQARAIQTLLLIPGASWFNPDIARKFERAYKRGVRNARKTTVSGTGKYSGGAYSQTFGGVTPSGNYGANSDFWSD